MNVKIRKTEKNGVNSEGLRWRADIELPFFENEGLDAFYCEAQEKIMKCCEDTGVSCIAYFFLSRNDERALSMYTDMVFHRKRELAGLYRLCDTRDADGNVLVPKRVKLRSFDGFYIRGDKIIGVKNRFDSGQSGVKMRDYSSFFEEKILCSFPF